MNEHDGIGRFLRSLLIVLIWKANKILIGRLIRIKQGTNLIEEILRWGIAAEELNGQFTGMKLTNDPAITPRSPLITKATLS